MMAQLPGIAGARLHAAPQPLQRYGLSVFLRKAYPNAGSKQQVAGNRGPVVHGAEVRRVAWDDLPADVGELMRRASVDGIFAAHVAQVQDVTVLQVTGDQEVELSGLLLPGNASTLFVDVAPGATATITDTPKSAFLEESRFRRADIEGSVASTVVLLRLGAGARLSWYARSLGTAGFAFVERLAVLAQNAVLEHHSALIAANAMRENVHVVLGAPGATARVQTLFAGAADHQFDLGVTAEHRAPHTVSDLRAKGVLGGKAQGVYRGLVRVGKEASGSDGYQRCDALLLSPAAEVDPIPNLEINTNDVRCTHGVTVSRVDPGQLFYLQSRGFSADAARQLLVEGFVGSVLQHYPDAAREALVTAVYQTSAESV